jgi:hypothetical protein
MELFDKETLLNLLPSHGEAIYFGKVFTSKESQYYLDKLLKDIAWKNNEVTVFGKKITTNRKVASYGENNIQ